MSEAFNFAEAARTIPLECKAINDLLDKAIATCDFDIVCSVQDVYQERMGEDWTGWLQDQEAKKAKKEKKEAKDASIKDYNRKYGIVKLPNSTRILVKPEGIDELHRIIGQTDFLLETMPDREIVTSNDGKTHSVPFAKTWLQSPDRREYNSIIFAPNMTRDEAFKKSGAYNMFDRFAVYPKTRGTGDWSLLRTHILENVCQGNEAHFAWLMTWLSDLFQNPADKKGSAVVIKGKKGVGKTKLFEWVRKAIGMRHSRVIASKEHLTGRFNGHQADCLFLLAEEAMWAGDPSVVGVLKNMITGNWIMIERKNVDSLEVASCMRIGFTSNEDWIIPFGGKDERRFFVLECGDAHQQEIQYFSKIDAQMNAGGLLAPVSADSGLQAMVYDLLHWQPSEHGLSWDDLRKPPYTEEAEKQTQQGLTALQEFFVETVEAGEVPWRGSEYASMPIIALEENKSVCVHAKLFREYARVYVMKHARLGEALRLMKRFDETLHEAFNVAEHNSRTEAIGRETGKKGRTIELPSIETMRNDPASYAAWLQPAIRKLSEVETDSTPELIVTIGAGVESSIVGSVESNNTAAIFAAEAEHGAERSTPQLTH